MKKKLYTLFVFISAVVSALNTSGYAFCHTDSVKNISYVYHGCHISLDSIQDYILKNEIGMASVYGRKPECFIGLTLRAFKTWCDSYNGLDNSVVVFEYSDPYWSQYLNTDISSLDLNNQKIRARYIYFLKRPFKTYPKYKCLDIARFISDPKTLVNVRAIINDFDPSYYVRIEAYIPTRREKGAYERVRFTYAFSLFKKGGVSDFEHEKYNNSLIKNLKCDSDFLVGKDGRYYPRHLWTDFEWRLWYCSRDEKLRKTIYTIEEMPTTVEGLFGK